MTEREEKRGEDLDKRERGGEELVKEVIGVGRLSLESIE